MPKAGINNPFISEVNLDTNTYYWILPLNDTEDSQEGRIILPSDLFAFELNNLENGPKQFEIFGIPDKSSFELRDLNHNTDNIVIPQFHSSDYPDMNIVKLHSYMETDKHTSLINNHLLFKYNQVWKRKTFYYLLIIFYNTNSDTPNKLIFDNLKHQYPI